MKKTILLVCCMFVYCTLWAQTTKLGEKPTGEGIRDALLELTDENTSDDITFTNYYHTIVDGLITDGASKVNLILEWKGKVGSGVPDNIFTLVLNMIMTNARIEYLDATKSGLGNTFSGRFLGASTLKTIKLPTITSLHNDVFNGLTALEYLQIDNWNNTQETACPIENIGSNAFRGCTSIAGLSFEVSGTVGDDVFRGCSSLTSVPVKPAEGNTSLKLGSYVLGECAGLTDVTIPEGIVEIGENAFNGCANLKMITLSSKVTSVSFNSIDGCTAFEGFKVSEANSTLAAHDGAIYSKDYSELKLFPMTKAADENYTWHGGLKNIAGQAFRKCSKLTGIKLPEGVETIGGDAFAESSIASLYLPSTVNDIVNTFVNNCPDLKTISVAEANTVYKSHNSILYKKTTDGFTLVSCPAQLVVTGGELNLFSMETELGGKVIGLGADAFYKNQTIKRMILPDNLTSFPDQTFNGCAIEELSIPYNLEEWGVAVMVDCISFKKYFKYEGSTGYTQTTQGSMIYDKAKAFAVDGLGILYKFDDEGEITMLYSVPAQYTPQAGDGAFRIYDNIRVIHSNCFQNTQNIKDVFIPQGIMAVPHQCFMNSKVEKITIPNSVVRLGQDVFRGCNDLKNVYFLTTSTMVPLSQNGNGNIFYGYNPTGGGTFHFSTGYPGLLEAYQNEATEIAGADVAFKTLYDSKTVNFVADINHRALFEDNETISGFEYKDLAGKMESPMAADKYSAANIRDNVNARNKLDGDTQYEYITLYRDFEAANDDEYNTLALPFSLTRAQVNEKFGEGTKMYEFIGRYGNTVKFETVDLTTGVDDEIVVKKGVAVLIKPTRKRHSYLFQLTDKNSFAAVHDTEGSMTETSINSIDENDLKETTDNTTRYENGTAVTGVTFKHAFYATYQANVKVGPYFYYVTADGKVGYATKQRNITKAFRGFILGNEHDGSSPMDISAAKVNIDIDGVVTGLDEMKIEGVNTAMDGNVYSIDGRLVSHSVSSLGSLPKGLYIVNGKKIAIK